MLQVPACIGEFFFSHLQRKFFFLEMSQVVFPENENIFLIMGKSFI